MGPVSPPHMQVSRAIDQAKSAKTALLNKWTECSERGHFQSTAADTIAYDSAMRALQGKADEEIDAGYSAESEARLQASSTETVERLTRERGAVPATEGALRSILLEMLKLGPVVESEPTDSEEFRTAVEKFRSFESPAYFTPDMIGRHTAPVVDLAALGSRYREKELEVSRLRLEA
jgi:hypothetical protein